LADELVKVVEDSARGGFFLISGTTFATVIMAIASILIARLLGPELYGQYTITLVAPQLLYLFTDLGIGQGMIKFTASLRTKGETTRIRKIVKCGLLLRTLAGTIIFIINYTFANFFASYFFQRPDLAPYIRIASLSILFQPIFATAASAFVGLDKTEYNALAMNVQAIAKTVISIVLVFFGFSVAGAVIGYTASYIAAATASILILIYTLRGNGKTENDHKVLDDLKTLTHYVAPLCISLLLTGFIPIYKNIILAIFAADGEIGNYKAALNFATLITVLSVPITTALLPAFSKLDSSTGKTIKTFFKLANKYTAMIVVPITVLIILFSNEIVQTIYGSTYHSASLFLAAYCPVYFLVGMGYLTLASLYNGLGETKTTLEMSLITFLLLITLSPMLTKTCGVLGIIMAFLMANTAGTIYGAYKARRKFQIEFDAGLMIKIYSMSAVSGIPPFLLLQSTLIPRFFNVIIAGLLYLLIYMTLMPLTRIVDTSELQTGTRVMQKIRPLAPLAKPVLGYQQKILQVRANHRNLQKSIFWR